MRRHISIAVMGICLSANVLAQSASSSVSSTSSQKPIMLDHVVAIINGEVLLESDVKEEMRLAALQPISVPAGQNNEIRATQRLISRSLIVRQMREQQQIDYAVTDEDVTKSLDELRKQLPICGQLHCTTPEGWQSFLKLNGLTEPEVFSRWKQRLEILKFVQLRFGSGIRISRQDIETYYKTNVVRAFEKLKQQPPPLTNVTDRIREILLQQQVNVLLRDWLRSLREQGSVQILDPAYGQSITNDDDDNGGGS
jgi:peptidyl-prolyl cis-trans isomerase SurA